MSDLFNTGIRPAIDEYLKKKSEELRDYGLYWSASSAGYCQRLVIMRRLLVPKVPELQDDQARTTRVFEAGHLFHEWIQRITKDAGLSIASEVELQDEDLLIRGHFDDLIKIDDRLILMDYKTANSKSFDYPKPEIGFYHKMQLGSYMMMLRKGSMWAEIGNISDPNQYDLTEARILTLEKDTLRMKEHQLFWSPALESEVLAYWNTLNTNWKNKTLPKCTCHVQDGGWLARRTKAGKVYNDYFYGNEPCSLEWAKLHRELFKGWKLA